MKWNVRGEKTHTTIVLAAVVCISLMMLTIGLATSATAHAAPTLSLAAAGGRAVDNAQVSQNWAGSHTIVVKPNGHDDTAGIQAAFNACTSWGRPCTVQLVRGTYFIAQITVYGFQGSLVGMGQGSTIVQGLPNLPTPAPAYNTSTSPFWAGLPGPQNPWPALLTFVNGSFAISGMTITDPYTDAVAGWNSTAIGGGVPLDTALYAAVEVTGVQAVATVDHVTVLGAPGDAGGTNMWNAVDCEGFFLPPGWTNPFLDVVPLSGIFSVTNSVFNMVETGPLFDTMANAEVTVCYNTLTNSEVPMALYSASNSQVWFCGNRVPNLSYGAGILVFQSINQPNTPSTVYISGNYFQVNNGANAVDLFDLGADWGIASTLSAVVSGNVFQTNTTCGCYVGSDPSGYSVIISESLKSLVVAGNTILGGGAAGVYVLGGPAVVSGNTILGSTDGVWVDYANNVWVMGNLIKNSVAYGIAVTDGSSNNVVAWNFVKNSGVDDLYWDGTGTGNAWIGNVFGTSSPSGL
jgi:hypothetical protein